MEGQRYLVTITCNSRTKTNVYEYFNTLPQTSVTIDDIWVETLDEKTHTANN